MFRRPESTESIAAMHRRVTFEQKAKALAARENDVVREAEDAIQSSRLQDALTFISAPTSSDFASLR